MREQDFLCNVEMNPVYTWRSVTLRPWEGFGI